MELVSRLADLLFPIAVVWFAVLSTVRLAVIIHRGYRTELGAAKGDPRRGILYSLTFSMLPWKKDSTFRHPWTYAAGMAMHLGVFLTLLFALGRQVGTWPQPMVALFGTASGLGFASALGLFVKRGTRQYMQDISTLDDFLGNVLVQLWLLTACIAAFVSAAAGLWRLAAGALLIYVPLGKTFHMLLFFVSRTLFGLQFGRRGVLRHSLPISY